MCVTSLLCGPWADLWPFYRLWCNRFALYISHFTSYRENPAIWWFSVVTPFKIDQNKIKTIWQIKSRIWEMKGGKYTKTLAKIWVEGIIRIRDIRGNVLPKFIELCMETPCWSSSGWAPTWRTETNRNICYRVLLQKREFTRRGTHKH